MQKMPGRSTAPGCILQNASQHAFLDILTHIPLCSARYVTPTEPPRAGFIQSLSTPSKSYAFSFHFILQHGLRLTYEKKGQS